MKQWQSIISHIEQTTGRSFSLEQQQSLAGGSINSAFCSGAKMLSNIL